MITQTWMRRNFVKYCNIKPLIYQKYRTLDAAGGGEEYCYFRNKEGSFKPSKNQGAGLTMAFFEEEASSKGKKRGLRLLYFAGRLSHLHRQLQVQLAMRRDKKQARRVQRRRVAQRTRGVEAG